MTRITANGHTVNLETDAFEPLRSSTDAVNDGRELRQRMAEDGYLYMPGLLPADAVLAARREILLKYATIGEIDAESPLMEAIFSNDSAVTSVNLRAFSESVRSGIAYERVVLHPDLLAVHEHLLEGEVQAYDMRWPRFARPGEGCGFHYDGPYMSRGTDRIFSSWIPLGDVSMEEGGLIILEPSERQDKLLAGYRGQDADRDKLEWIGTDPEALRRRFGGRWRGGNNRAGDVLCFTMHTLHGALDNNSEVGRCRLSSDSRYQRADEAFDQRWNGDNFEAHGHDKVFYPGLGRWNNKDFQDEWKRVDKRGRLIIDQGQ